MNKIRDNCFLVYLIWSILIIVLNINGSIAFGHGLGDVIYLGLIFLFTVAFALAYYKWIRKSTYSLWVKIFFVLLLIEILIVMLKLTIFRGPEYPWNGRFFL